MKTQRINTLLAGCWFPHYPERIPTTNSNPSKLGFSVPSLRAHSQVSNSKNNNGFIDPSHNNIIPRWRFYRLAPNRKHLHYVETPQPIPVSSGVEELHDRSKLEFQVFLVLFQDGSNKSMCRSRQLMSFILINQRIS